MENDLKEIKIMGTNNRYMMKKVIDKSNKIIKKKVDSKNWNFPEEYFNYENQLKFLNEILLNNFKHNNEITHLITKLIQKKILGYKQQDKIKKIYNENDFLKLENVIIKLSECQLKCYYCNSEILILYDIVREMKQWSIDRIDNNIGHNTNNFHIACLDCNLKRRSKSDEKFLFTKQLNIIKNE